MPLFLSLAPLLMSFVFKSTQKVVPTLPFSLFGTTFYRPGPSRLKFSQQNTQILQHKSSRSHKIQHTLYIYLSYTTDSPEKPPAQLSYLYREYTASTPLTFRHLSPAIFRGFRVLISHHIPLEPLCKSFPCP